MFDPHRKTLLAAGCGRPAGWLSPVAGKVFNVEIIASGNTSASTTVCWLGRGNFSCFSIVLQNRVVRFVC